MQDIRQGRKPMRKTQSRLKHLCATLVMGLLLAAGLPAQAQLDILLTNDDGFGEAGIEALKSALRAAGHLVTVGLPTAMPGRAAHRSTLSVRLSRSSVRK